MQGWRVRVREWDELTPNAQRNLLMVAGEQGAEWWGAGLLEFTASPAVHSFLVRARELGVHVKMDFWLR